MEQLVNSGLSIKDALEVCTLITKKNDNIAININEQIKKGVSFSDAINNMSNIFPSVYRGIISVGNRIGSIEKIFPRLRLYLETQKKIKDKLTSSLIYPILVLITAILVFSAMIIFVFPKLKTIFMEFGGEAAVQLERNIANLERSSSIFLLTIFLILLLFLITSLIQKQNLQLKEKIDFLKLHIPLIGKFLVYLETLNFTFAMETLLAGGITIEDAILESETVVNNTAYKTALKDIRERITRGELLSKSFEIHKNIMPDYLIKWMAIGEKSGKSTQIFSQLRNYFQNEIDLYTTKFMALIEPILIIIIGIFLIILIFNIVVPVFSLYGSII